MILSSILQMDFGEFYFHALGCIGPYQMRSAPMHGIMAAPREEDSWLIGIAGTVVMNWPKTIASVLIAEPLRTKRLTCPHHKLIGRGYRRQQSATLRSA